MAAQPVIDILKESDLDEAVAMLVRAFDSRFEKDARIELQRSLGPNPDARITFVARLDGKIVGTVQCMMDYVHTDTYCLFWVGADPDYQGVGVGRALMAHAENHIARDLLKGKPGTVIITDYTRIRNPESGYYTSQGYVPGPLTHNGAPVMVKILNGEA